MILLDFSPIILGAAFISGDELSEDLLRHLTLNCILSYRRKFKKAGEMIICFDDRNYWRKDIHPEYKGHRAKAKEQSDFDWTSFYQYQDTIKEEFKRVFPYRWIQIDRLEADDIIGWLGLTAKEETIIVSPDGDFWQCMRNPRVKVYSTLKKKFVPEQTLHEIEYGLHKKIMKGDGGDNIKNVFTPLGSTERQKPVTERLIEHTFEQGLGQDIKSRYEQNQALIDFRKIPTEYKQKIEESLNEPIIGSKARVFNYLTQKKLNKIGSFIKDIDDFC